jgi:multidrug efflux pump subunit AcrA (membrane-fusion protein)
MNEKNNGTEKKSAKKIKKSTVLVAAVCVVFLIVAAAVVNRTKQKNGGMMNMGGGGQNVVSVKTAAAENSVLHDYVETNGEIECESSIDVYPDIGGKVSRLFVSLGDFVKKGAVIAEVDPNEPGSYFVNSAVIAPVSGTITSTPKDVGYKVAVSTSITTIGDVTNLQIRGKVPEKYVANVKIGLKADVTLESCPGQIFQATVKKVSPVLDATSRTKEIILTFDESDSRINAGMFAKVKLFTLDYSGIIVPEDAVVTRNSTTTVFVLSADGNSAEQREVVTGNSVDGYVQVLSGVNEGEKIIVEGMSILYDGAKVHDVDSVSAEKNSAEQNEKFGSENSAENRNEKNPDGKNGGGKK